MGAGWGGGKTVGECGSACVSHLFLWGLFYSMGGECGFVDVEFNQHVHLY